MEAYKASSAYYLLTFAPFFVAAQQMPEPLSPRQEASRFPMWTLSFPGKLSNFTKLFYLSGLYLFLIIK